MKTLIKSIPWVLVAILAGLHLFNISKPQEIKSSEKTIKEIHSDRDSLTQVIHAKTDTIQALRTRRETLEYERDKAERERNLLIQQHEKIKFVSYPNDSVRDSILAKLYSSFKAIR